jgi:hypothetical protein
MKVGTRRAGVWAFIGFLYVLIIGFRDQVGCDWLTYLDHYISISKLPLLEALKETDSAYAALNWLSASLGFGIYGVNVICGAIAITGIFKFSRQQPLPWLALTVAVPYLIIVTLMGYSRQGVAIGLILWGLSVLQERRVLHYVLLTILAALFHKTAVIMLPLALVYSKLGLKARLLILIPVTALAVRLLFLDSYDTLMENYVVSEMQSDGGLVRVLINAAAASVFFAVMGRWRRKWDDSRIWVCLAAASMVSIPLVFISSTAVDRMTLFLLPLQLAIYARLPVLFRDHLTRLIVGIFIISSYGVLLYVWLTRSEFARACWVPYKSFLVN